MTSETVFWYYKSSANPWPNLSTADSNLDGWTKYRDIEIDLIEEAYQDKKTCVLLDRYRIDLKHFIQINRINATKQRLIKRQTGSNHTEYLRKHRFTSMLSTTPSSRSSSFNNFHSWCPFLTAWYDTPSGKRAILDFSTCINACAEGIIREAALRDDHNNAEAAYMAEKIRYYSKKSRAEVSEQCIRFYTQDSFLYEVLNQAMRELDHSKLETFGPWCFLMRSYSRVSKDYIGSVYRGIELNYSQIEEYKEHVGEWRSWPAFTSTSKDREMAEMFGGTLLIIEVTDVKLSSIRAYDIAHISRFPDEKEVLLPAGVSFQILKVEEDPSQKLIIHIKM